METEGSMAEKERRQYLVGRIDDHIIASWMVMLSKRHGLEITYDQALAVVKEKRRKLLTPDTR